EKVLGAQLDLHVFDDSVVDQHRAQKRLLGLQVVRKADGCEGVLRRRRGDGYQCHWTREPTRLRRETKAPRLGGCDEPKGINGGCSWYVPMVAVARASTGEEGICRPTKNAARR